MSMREDFEALDEYNKRRRENNRKKYNERKRELKSVGIKMIRDEGHTWLLEADEKRFCFWPPSGKWQWGGRVHAGGFDSFLGFMRKRVNG